MNSCFLSQGYQSYLGPNLDLRDSSWVGSMQPAATAVGVGPDGRVELCLVSSMILEGCHRWPCPSGSRDLVAVHAPQLLIAFQTTGGLDKMVLHPESGLQVVCLEPRFYDIYICG